MTTREVLVQARDRIENEENWTREAVARDRDGTEVPTRSPRACQWCAIGAIWATGPTRAYVSRRAAHVALGIAACQLDDIGAATYNDTQSHAKVMDMFDLAISSTKNHN